MRRAWALLVAVGCGEAEPTAPCVPARDVVVSPADGAEAVSTDAPVRVTGSGDLSGVEVWVDGGATAGWQPLDPEGGVPLTGALASEAAHLVRVRQCGSILAESRFRTGPGPVGAGLEGRVFLFDLLSAELDWAEPTSPPDPALLRALLSDTRGVLLALGDGGAVVAVAEDETGEVRQDACLPALPDVPIGGSDPAIEVGPVDVSFDGEATTIEAMVLSGVALDGGVRVRGLRLEGRVDMRRVGGSTGEALCGALQPAYGSTCLPCADQGDGEDPMCMLLDATLPEAAAGSLPVVAEPVPHAWCR